MLPRIISPIFIFVFQLLAFLFLLDLRRDSLLSYTMELSLMWIFVVVTTLAIVAVFRKIYKINRIWSIYQFSTTIGLHLIVHTSIYIPYTLVAFGLTLVLLYLPVWRQDIPYYPSPSREILNALPVSDGMKIADLGAGFGILGIRLLRKFNVEVYSFETSPICYLVGWIFNKMLGSSNGNFNYASFWEEDLGKYDLVFNYLSPSVIDRLYNKWLNESKSGQLFISYEFPVTWDENCEVVSLSRANLYIFRKSFNL